MRDYIFLDLLENGVYVAKRGLIALSLAIGDADITDLLELVRRRSARWRGLTNGR